MKRRKYEKELGKLQVRLCYLQEWVREKGLRVVMDRCPAIELPRLSAA